ncbi:PRD domain-containing protein [Klebsiella quasipneumoniae]|uniref:BglG family transcription antiterminator LicT n=1 Tax=Klebsiella quasipneumoniae TaxID=1463165 RepID=UPI001E4D32C8|nr:PRD domain-containing protein [Klebsiella quasipneumoniae]MDI3216173.1 PRD domain-containing protein [Klebsiella quasipneumoniae]UAA17056.2 PRD domain-containing protein [Klebsiella quasipneumoniae]
MHGLGFFVFVVIEAYGQMKVQKIINNNQIICTDRNGDECIAIGKGLGFQSKPGETVAPEKIEKIFKLDDTGVSSKFQNLVKKIPYEHIQVTDEIIQYFKLSLGKKLSDNIYISLTDHLNFAIERTKKGIVFTNPLTWETKRFYNHEYALGLYAIKHIKNRIGIELPQEEAGFIALHIVNALTTGIFDETIAMTRLIQGVLNIVKYNFNIEFDEEGLDYYRFLTHLRFFSQRLLKKQSYTNGDQAFINTIRSQYPREYACADKVKKYVFVEYKYNMTEEETLYLVVHINRLLNSNR